MDDYEHVPLPALPTPLLEIGVLGGSGSPARARSSRAPVVVRACW